MLKSRYSLGLLSGIVACLVVTGLVGQVMANNFSGPASEPPNGRVVPTLDGLVINGDLTVNGNTDLLPRSNSGDDVYIKSLDTARLGGCFGCPEADNYGDGSEYLRITAPYLDVTGSKIFMGGISSDDQLRIYSHSKIRSIGYMYESKSTKTISNAYSGRLNMSYVTCPSSTYMVSCTSYLYDYGMDYKHEGNNHNLASNTCYGYARQTESNSDDATLTVTATCWDPDNLYNKNF